jgi:MFS family permease
MSDIDAAAETGQQRQSSLFLLLYALAVAGGAMAYVPFLTILLPMKVEIQAGGESISWLAYLAVAGAVAASLANILFGWLSDVTGNRRGWALIGLISSSILLVTMAQAQGFAMLIAMLVVWQLCLNMMLGPLAAWAGDVVPDRQKGMLGGLLAFAPALGAMSGVLVTIPGLAEADTRMMLVAFLVVIFVAPVLVFGRPVPFPDLMQPNYEAIEPNGRASRKTVISMWIARLLVQIAEAALFAYLYLWLRSISQEIGDSDVAQILGFVLLISVPLALMVGRWSDRNDRPILPLGLAAAVSAVALLLMAASTELTGALMGYALFGLAAAVFLALHSAQTLRVLPRPQSRGRDLGFFNLTNTVPSLIMPGLALAMIPVFGFAGLFVLLALLAALASALLLAVSRIK